MAVSELDLFCAVLTVFYSAGLQSSGERWVMVQMVLVIGFFSVFVMGW